MRPAVLPARSAEGAAGFNVLCLGLMIPKTCAYVWTVLIGYSAMKKECS